MFLLQRNVFHKYWLFGSRLSGLHYFAFCHCSSVNKFICHFLTKQYNYAVDQSELWPDSEQILHHQYGISVTATHSSLLVKRPEWWRARRGSCFHRLIILVFQYPTLIYCFLALYSISIGKISENIACCMGVWCCAKLKTIGSPRAKT